MNAHVKAPAVQRAREHGRKDGGVQSENQLVELIESIKCQIKENNQKAAEHGDKLVVEIKKIGEAQNETKTKVDEVLVKSSELDGRLKEVEQQLAKRRGGSDPEQHKSWGQAFVESENGKALMAAGKGRAQVSVKSITSATGSGAALITPDRQPGIISAPMRSMTIRSLLMPGSTTSNSVEYVKETGFTNNARPVTEGQQKPESTIAFEEATANVRTIAHWVQASRQVLADAAQLLSHIDGRMLYGLAYKEELQLLSGDGTGQNLSGLKTEASAFSAPISLTGMTKIDVIRLAYLQVILAEYPANGVILHPSDWTEIELTKDGNGRYIFANPQGLAGPTLWGRPVVESMAQTAGDFTAGAFNMAAQIFDRETSTVEVSTEDRDNFVKNMVTILAEERLALAVYRPEAIVDGAFLDVL